MRRWRNDSAARLPTRWSRLSGTGSRRGTCLWRNLQGDRVLGTVVLRPRFNIDGGVPYPAALRAGGGSGMILKRVTALRANLALVAVDKHG